MEKEKQLTAVEWLLNELSIEGYFPCGIIPEIENQAKAMEKEQKIEFACKVVEVSSENYIQGKTTEQIAKELIKSE